MVMLFVWMDLRAVVFGVLVFILVEADVSYLCALRAVILLFCLVLMHTGGALYRWWRRKVLVPKWKRKGHSCPR